MRVLRVRHETPPLPMGCRWCGVDKRDHAQRWVPGRGFHGWVQPTTAQIEARLPFNIARQRRSAVPDPEQPAINAAGRQRAESAIKNKERTDEKE